jgi:hypothetical protein
VGITLAQTAIGENLKGAIKLSLVKNFVHPVLMAAAGYAMGMRGLALSVSGGCLGIASGRQCVFISQRYQEEEEVVTSAVAISTVFAMLSVTLVMALLPFCCPLEKLPHRILILKVQVVHEAIRLGSSDSAIDRAIGFCGLAKTAIHPGTDL